SFITFEYCRYPKVWIPACAGMTAERLLFFPINAAISNPVIPTNLHPVIPTKVGIQDAESQETVYPISFRADRPRFPPARE
ncbi:TPA: hypothetical protein ACJVEJ_001635, partial [Neisseria meningitidis]